MKKLIILLFLLISTPVLAGDKHIEIDLQVSEIVFSMGKPDYQYQHTAYWFDNWVMIVCEIKSDGADRCFMDKTLEELKQVPSAFTEDSGDIPMLVLQLQKK